MKNSKIYTYLGIAGALLVPALAVAAIDIPNVFAGGEPVSASQMNENFEAMADAIDTLETKVEALENAGLQAPIVLKHYDGPVEDLVTIYQVHSDGVVSARSMGSGLTGVTVRFDVSPTEAGARNCDGTNCSQSVARGQDGSSGVVFVPAGDFVTISFDELADGGNAKIFWQPLHGPDPSGMEPTLIDE